MPEAVALPVVKLLLLHGADPNTRLKNTRVKGRVAEETPLHLAARCGHPAIAECLLKAGADVFAGTRRTNNQPLHEALFGGADGFTTDKERVASLLLKHGADINAAMRGDGQTPLTTACVWANEKVALFLLRNGANTQAGSQWRPNVLHEVMLYFYRWARVPDWSGAEDFPPNAPVMEVIDLVLDAGVDVNAADSRGGNAASHCGRASRLPGSRAATIKARSEHQRA
jgi:ankyrin repeat protein